MLYGLNVKRGIKFHLLTHIWFELAKMLFILPSQGVSMGQKKMLTNSATADMLL